MAAKKKGKKANRVTRAAGKKVISARRAPKKKAPRKLATKKKGKTSARKAIAAEAHEKSRRTAKQPPTASFTREAVRSRSGAQAGDLQGLRDIESADSESVSDLIEEGNAFEADVVAGVEDADDELREVRTHEVPQDDVPGEYEDKD